MTDPTIPPGEDALRAALRESLAINQREVRLADETIQLLRGEIKYAASQALAEAMTDDAAERFWAKGLEVLQRQATERTGRLVLGGLTELFKKAMLIAIAVVILYNAGGWALLKAVWSAGSSKGMP